MYPERLKEIRTEKNMSQEQLASVLFVSRSTIAMWETGKRIPGYKSLNALSKIFDRRSIYYIMGHSFDQISLNYRKAK